MEYHVDECLTDPPRKIQVLPAKAIVVPVGHANDTTIHKQHNMDNDDKQLW